MNDGKGKIVRKGARKKDRDVSAPEMLGNAHSSSSITAPAASLASGLMDPMQPDVNDNTPRKLMKVTQCSISAIAAPQYTPNTAQYAPKRGARMYSSEAE